MKVDFRTAGNAYFSRNDAPALTVSTAVTAEVLFNVTSFTTGGNTPFVGQWNKDSTYGQRSWLLCARSGKLRFCTSSDGGTDIIQKDSSLTVAVNVDYYAAQLNPLFLCRRVQGIQLLQLLGRHGRGPRVEHGIVFGELLVTPPPDGTAVFVR